MDAFFEGRRLGEEGPREELVHFGDAVGAILDHGLLGGDPGFESHGESLKGDFGIGDGQQKLT